MFCYSRFTRMECNCQGQTSPVATMGDCCTKILQLTTIQVQNSHRPINSWEMRGKKDRFACLFLNDPLSISSTLLSGFPYGVSKEDMTLVLLHRGVVGGFRGFTVHLTCSLSCCYLSYAQKQGK